MSLCSAWISADDVAACCSEEAASDSSVFDSVAAAASELLFELSGRRYPGICEQTVRPCNVRCFCPWQVLSRGHIVWNPYTWGAYPSFYGWWCDDNPCGCTPVSKVKLAGYVQSVSQVKIDGSVVDPATYRVDRHEYLQRMNDPAEPDMQLRWPGCQNLQLEDDQSGTWSVTYQYGKTAPRAGMDAAAELACELYKQCLGQQCKLPTGWTRTTRQGVTVDRLGFLSWSYQFGGSRAIIKGWRTGLPLVDAFLTAYNPAGLLRQPTIWAPSITNRYPLPWS